MEKMSDYVRRI